MYTNCGVNINGRYPASKKEVREAVREAPDTVTVHATAITGGYSGPVADIPEGIIFAFVGPDPYQRRNFYGNIERRGNKILVS